MQNKKDYNCWPNSTQLLLIKAGSLPPKQAIHYWHQWRSLVDIQELDSASNRLLSLVYHNLKSSGIDSKEFQVCKSTYRYTWVSNKVLFHELFNVIELFEKNNIDVVLLKGAALCVGYCHDLGARVMGDIDILIPKEKALKTVQLLLDEGWQAAIASSLKFDERFLKWRHGINLAKNNSLNIDIHWHILPETCNTEIERDFIANSVNCMFQERSFNILQPADQLFHALVHGLKYSPEPLIRWIPDALAIISSSPPLDWERLVQLAKQTRLSCPLLSGLQFLKENFALEIPDDIIRLLKNLAVSHAEIKAFQQGVLKKSANPAQSIWLSHTRLSGFASLPHRLVTFPSFVAYIWGIDNLWSLPFHIAYRYGRYYLRRFKKAVPRDTIQA